MNPLVVNNKNVFVFKGIDRVERVIRVKTIGSLVYDIDNSIMTILSNEGAILHTMNNVSIEQYTGYKIKFAATDDYINDTHNYKYPDVAEAQISLFGNSSIRPF